MSVVPIRAVEAQPAINQFRREAVTKILTEILSDYRHVTQHWLEETHWRRVEANLQRLHEYGIKAKTPREAVEQAIILGLYITPEEVKTAAELREQNEALQSQVSALQEENENLSCQLTAAQQERPAMIAALQEEEERVRERYKDNPEMLQRVAAFYRKQHIALFADREFDYTDNTGDRQIGE